MASGQHDYGGQERRQRRRRDDDVARDVIIDNAVHDAPIVNRLVKASERVTKVGGAGLLVGGLIGALAVGLGFRIVGPSEAQALIATRIGANSTRIDSLAHVVAELAGVVSDLSRTSDNILIVECSRLEHEKSDARDLICKKAP